MYQNIYFFAEFTYAYTTLNLIDDNKNCEQPNCVIS